MRSATRVVAFVVLFCSSILSAQTAVKDWTIIVFINGNNNLDYYGGYNIKEMEKVGSTDNVNVVVQWASMQAGDTKRLLAKKSTNPSEVTSPIVQKMGVVDMGDWKTLVAFVKWSVENYPAKHYMIDVWNHGSGWHKDSAGQIVRGISYDEISGNHMTIPQLAQAMGEAVKIMGHKVDVYASDACLMGMVEIGTELADTVDMYAGSEETEPGEGWPYDKVLGRFVNNASTTPTEVAKALVEEYTKSYQGGSHGSQEVTMSAFNLAEIGDLNKALSTLSVAVKGVSSASRSKVVQAASNTQNYYYKDYVDLGDLVKNLGSSGINEISASVYQGVKDMLSKVVVANSVTSEYSKSTGIAIWFPTDRFTYDKYSKMYGDLQFDRYTTWGAALNAVITN